MPILNKIPYVYRATRKLRPGMRIFERYRSYRVPPRSANSRRSVTGSSVLKNENQKEIASNSRIYSKIRIEEPDSGLVLNVKLKYSFREIPANGLPFEPNTHVNESHRDVDYVSQVDKPSKKSVGEPVEFDHDKHLTWIEQTIIPSQTRTTTDAAGKNVLYKTESNDFLKKFNARVRGTVDVDTPSLNNQQLSEVLEKALRSVFTKSVNSLLQKACTQNNFQHVNMSSQTTHTNDIKKETSYDNHLLSQTCAKQPASCKTNLLDASINETKPSGENKSIISLSSLGDQPARIITNSANIAQISTSTLKEPSAKSEESYITLPTNKKLPSQFSPNTTSPLSNNMDKHLAFELPKSLTRDTLALATMHSSTTASDKYPRKEKKFPGDVPPFYYIVPKLKDHEEAKRRQIQTQRQFKTSEGNSQVEQSDLSKSNLNETPSQPLNVGSKNNLNDISMPRFVPENPKGSDVQANSEKVIKDNEKPKNPSELVSSEGHTSLDSVSTNEMSKNQDRAQEVKGDGDLRYSTLDTDKSKNLAQQPNKSQSELHCPNKKEDSTSGNRKTPAINLINEKNASSKTTTSSQLVAIGIANENGFCSHPQVKSSTEITDKPSIQNPQGVALVQAATEGLQKISPAEYNYDSRAHRNENYLSRRHSNKPKQSMQQKVGKRGTAGTSMTKVHRNKSRGYRNFAAEVLKQIQKAYIKIQRALQNSQNPKLASTIKPHENELTASKQNSAKQVGKPSKEVYTPIEATQNQIITKIASATCSHTKPPLSQIKNIETIAYFKTDCSNKSNVQAATKPASCSAKDAVKTDCISTKPVPIDCSKYKAGKKPSTDSSKKSDTQAMKIVGCSEKDTKPPGKEASKPVSSIKSPQPTPPPPASGANKATCISTKPVKFDCSKYTGGKQASADYAKKSDTQASNSAGCGATDNKPGKSIDCGKSSQSTPAAQTCGAPKASCATNKSAPIDCSKYKAAGTQETKTSQSCPKTTDPQAKKPVGCSAQNSRPTEKDAGDPLDCSKCKSSQKMPAGSTCGVAKASCVTPKPTPTDCAKFKAGKQKSKSCSKKSNAQAAKPVDCSGKRPVDKNAGEPMDCSKYKLSPSPPTAPTCGANKPGSGSSPINCSKQNAGKQAATSCGAAKASCAANKPAAVDCSKFKAAGDPAGNKQSTNCSKKSDAKSAKSGDGCIKCTMSTSSTADKTSCGSTAINCSKYKVTGDKAEKQMSTNCSQKSNAPTAKSGDCCTKCTVGSNCGANKSSCGSSPTSCSKNKASGCNAGKKESQTSLCSQKSNTQATKSDDCCTKCTVGSKCGADKSSCGSSPSSCSKNKASGCNAGKKESQTSLCSQKSNTRAGKSDDCCTKCTVGSNCGADKGSCGSSPTNCSKNKGSACSAGKQESQTSICSKKSSTQNTKSGDCCTKCIVGPTSDSSNGNCGTTPINCSKYRVTEGKSGAAQASCKSAPINCCKYKTEKSGSVQACCETAPINCCKYKNTIEKSGAVQASCETPPIDCCKYKHSECGVVQAKCGTDPIDCCKYKNTIEKSGAVQASCETPPIDCCKYKHSECDVVQAKCGTDQIDCCKYKNTIEKSGAVQASCGTTPIDCCKYKDTVEKSGAVQTSCGSSPINCCKYKAAGCSTEKKESNGSTCSKNSSTRITRSDDCCTKCTVGSNCGAGKGSCGNSPTNCSKRKASGCNAGKKESQTSLCSQKSNTRVGKSDDCCTKRTVGSNCGADKSSCGSSPTNCSKNKASGCNAGKKESQTSLCSQKSNTRVGKSDDCCTKCTVGSNCGADKSSCGSSPTSCSKNKASGCNAGKKESQTSHCSQKSNTQATKSDDCCTKCTVGSNCGADKSSCGSSPSSCSKNKASGCNAGKKESQTSLCSQKSNTRVGKSDDCCTKCTVGSNCGADKGSCGSSSTNCSKNKGSACSAGKQESQTSICSKKSSTQTAKSGDCCTKCTVGPTSDSSNGNCGTTPINCSKYRVTEGKSGAAQASCKSAPINCCKYKTEKSGSVQASCETAPINCCKYKNTIEKSGAVQASCETPPIDCCKYKHSECGVVQAKCGTDPIDCCKYKNCLEKSGAVQAKCCTDPIDCCKYKNCLEKSGAVQASCGTSPINCCKYKNTIEKSGAVQTSCGTTPINCCKYKVPGCNAGEEEPQAASCSKKSSTQTTRSGDCCTKCTVGACSDSAKSSCGSAPRKAAEDNAGDLESLESIYSHKSDNKAWKSGDCCTNCTVGSACGADKNNCGCSPVNCSKNKPDKQACTGCSKKSNMQASKSGDCCTKCTIGLASGADKSSCGSTHIDCCKYKDTVEKSGAVQASCGSTPINCCKYKDTVEKSGAVQASCATAPIDCCKYKNTVEKSGAVQASCESPPINCCKYKDTVEKSGAVQASCGSTPINCCKYNAGCNDSKQKSQESICSKSSVTQAAKSDDCCTKCTVGSTCGAGKGSCGSSSTNCSKNKGAACSAVKQESQTSICSKKSNTQAAKSDDCCTKCTVGPACGADKGNCGTSLVNCSKYKTEKQASSSCSKKSTQAAKLDDCCTKCTLPYEQEAGRRSDCSSYSVSRQGSQCRQKKCRSVDSANADCCASSSAVGDQGKTTSCQVPRRIDCSKYRWTAPPGKACRPVVCLKQIKPERREKVPKRVQVMKELPPVEFNCCLKITGQRKVEIGNCPMPPLEDDHVVIKMHSVGICSSDVYMFEKGIRKIDAHDISLGHEGAGEIVEIGQKVTSLKKGDRVCIEAGVPCARCKYCQVGRYNICPYMQFSGLLATFCRHPARLCHKIPRTVKYEEAALVHPLSLGLQACDRGRVSVGSKVLILGACPIGLSAVIAARAMGADKIAIIDVTERNLQVASELCADISVVVNGSMSSEELADKILTEMKCRPNVIIDCCGCSKTVNMAVDVAEQGGDFVLAGCRADCVPFPILTALAKEVCFHTSFRSSNKFAKAVNMIATGKAQVSKMITHRTEFCETQKGFETALDEADKGTIKVMVNWPHEEDD